MSAWSDMIDHALLTVHFPAGHWPDAQRDSSKLDAVCLRMPEAPESITWLLHRRACNTVKIKMH